MRRLTFYIVAISLLLHQGVFAQETRKWMQVWVKGEMVCQTAYEEIDSIIIKTEKPHATQEDTTYQEHTFLPSAFSVSATHKITFSPGNLQYQASSNTWRFAINQYDYVGNDDCGNVYENGIKSNNYNASTDYDGWIDMFGFGTSGFDNTKCDSYATRFHPWDTATSIVKEGLVSKGGIRMTDDYYGYGPRTEMCFSDSLDWGIYNPIVNGGNKAGLWRNLTPDEWEYLMSERDHQLHKFLHGYAVVNHVTGMIFLPDNWSTEDVFPKYGFLHLEKKEYTIAEWRKLEQRGAIFCPVADTPKVNHQHGGCFSWDAYWAITPAYNAKVEMFIDIEGTNGVVFDSAEIPPYEHLFVRLVQDIKE